MITETTTYTAKDEAGNTKSCTITVSKGLRYTQKKRMLVASIQIVQVHLGDL